LRFLQQVIKNHE